MSTRSDADQLAAVVVESLDASGDADALARRAARSRTPFFRMFRARVDRDTVDHAAEARKEAFMAKRKATTTASRAI